MVTKNRLAGTLGVGDQHRYNPRAQTKWRRATKRYCHHPHWRYTIYKQPELNKKSEAIQVATLLTVIGKEAQEVFSTFVWTLEDDSAKIKPVLKNIVSHIRMCHSEGITSTAGCKNLVRRTISTVLHCLS